MYRYQGPPDWLLTGTEDPAVADRLLRWHVTPVLGRHMLMAEQGHVTLLVLMPLKKVIDHQRDYYE